MDTSLWIDDTDGNSIFHINDNVLTKSVAEKIIETQGHPTIAIVPYSGASMYPHAFDNYTDEEKLEKRDELRQRCLNSLFLDVAEVLNPRYVIPAAGSYVMGGSLARHNRYLHQATPQQVADFWVENTTISSKVFFLQEGDILDTETEAVLVNAKALLRDFTEADREQYGWTLVNRALDHEQILIPNSFEMPWPRILGKCRRNLWFQQQRLKVLPPVDVTLNLLEKNESVHIFKFSLDCESGLAPPQDTSNGESERYQIAFNVDSRLMMMVVLGATIWNNLEIGALMTVHRKPDRYHPTAHSLMSYFVL
jgi:UDP-MurNAc hydroxylase